MNESVIQTIDWLLGWPLNYLHRHVGLFCSLVLNFVQFRLFPRAWRLLIILSSSRLKKVMSPLQAFINTLSTNLGNGSIMGGSVAVYMGGPGAGLLGGSNRANLDGGSFC